MLVYLYNPNAQNVFLDGIEKFSKFITPNFKGHYHKEVVRQLLVIIQNVNNEYSVWVLFRSSSSVSVWKFGSPWRILTPIEEPNIVSAVKIRMKKAFLMVLNKQTKDYIHVSRRYGLKKKNWIQMCLGIVI